MAFDMNGETGLRRRLGMAVEPPNTYESAAATLGISVEILHNYLDNPEYVLTSDTYNQILTNLSLLPFNSHERQTTDRWRITFVEKPRWTPADIAGLARPAGVDNAVVFAYEGTYDSGISANGPVDLDVFDIQQTIDSAVNSDPDALITVVWYEHVD